MAWRGLGRLVPRDAQEQEAAGTAVEVAGYGDLVTYGAEQATHIAFWLGDGRILHAAVGRGVVEETEPEALLEVRRLFVRLEPRL
jgi:cell wall-associated NlpC family hydrolase